MVVLFPRLPGPAAEVLVRQFLELGPENWKGFNPRELPEPTRFAPTGGVRINDAQLQELRNQLVKIANAHGYSDDSTGRSRLADFDAAVSQYLALEGLLDSGEALRDDVWSFIGAVVCPDIVHWRFGRAQERYLGGVRNSFQRLWMRGKVMDRGETHSDRWGLLRELSEDAMVQITERPSIGADPDLALAIAEAWVRAAAYHGKPSMELLMRKAILRVRIKNEIQYLAALPKVELNRVLDGFFRLPTHTINLAPVQNS